MPSIVSLGICACSSGGLGFGVAIGADAPLEFGTEVADQALHRPRGGVAQRADGVAFDLIGDLLEGIDLGQRRLAFDHASHHAREPTTAFAARRALAAALVLVEIR